MTVWTSPRHRAVQSRVPAGAHVATVNCALGVLQGSVETAELASAACDARMGRHGATLPTIRATRHHLHTTQEDVDDDIGRERLLLYVGKSGGSVIQGAPGAWKRPARDQQPALASDGIQMRNGKGKPSSTGTLSQVLGRYVRDAGSLTQSAA